MFFPVTERFSKLYICQRWKPLKNGHSHCIIGALFTENWALCLKVDFQSRKKRSWIFEPLNFVRHVNASVLWHNFEIVFIGKKPERSKRLHPGYTSKIIIETYYLQRFFHRLKSKNNLLIQYTRPVLLTPNGNVIATKLIIPEFIGMENKPI